MPDVPLLATVATGLVSTFPDGPYKPAEPFRIGSPIYLTLMMLGGSLPDQTSVDKLVTEKAGLVLRAARESCTGEMRALAQKEGVTADNAYVEPIAKIEASFPSPTDMKPVRLPVPILLGTGLADSVLPPLRQYAAVAALCEAGNDAVWKTYPGITHNGGVNAAFPDALAFFKDVLAGRKPASNCADIVAPGLPTEPTKNIPFND